MSDTHKTLLRGAKVLGGEPRDVLIEGSASPRSAPGWTRTAPP